MLPWWECDRNIYMLLELGRLFLNKSADPVRIALGDGASWLVKAAEIIAAQENIKCNGNSIEFIYIPFSGHFFNTKILDLSPNEMKAEYRWSELTRLQQTLPEKWLVNGIDLNSIFRNLFDHHKSAAIVDFVLNGRSLASFLWLASFWSKHTDQENSSFDWRLYGFPERWPVASELTTDQKIIIKTPDRNPYKDVTIDPCQFSGIIIPPPSKEHGHLIEALGAPKKTGEKALGRLVPYRHAVLPEYYPLNPSQQDVIDFITQRLQIAAATLKPLPKDPRFEI